MSNASIRKKTTLFYSFWMVAQSLRYTYIPITHVQHNLPNNSINFLGFSSRELWWHIYYGSSKITILEKDHTLKGGRGKAGQYLTCLSFNQILFIAPFKKISLTPWSLRSWSTLEEELLEAKIPLFAFCSINVLWRDVGLKSLGLPISYLV